LTKTATATSIILSRIRSGKESRDAVIKELFLDSDLKSKISFITRRYSSPDQTMDHVFNETLMKFVKTVIKNPDLTIANDVHSYLCGIARYTCLNLIGKTKSRTKDLDAQFDIATDVTPETLILKQDKHDVLQGLLSKLGRNCQEVLMHWANGYSMKEIATMMNYKSDMMAKKKKYKCFKELLNYLEEHPEIKNILR